MSFSNSRLSGAVMLCCLSLPASVTAQGSEHSIRGVITAGAEAEISAALSARLSEVPYEMGDRFEKGALLIQFDCNRLKAEWAALKAAHKSLAKTQKSNRELFENGAAGALEVETSKADMERAAAEARAKETELSDCSIHAPYDGFLVERFVDVFETPAPGAPLIKIIDDSALEIKLIAPSTWLRWLKVNEDFTFTIDETDAVYPAKIIRIGASVDSVSQTIDLVAQFTEDTPNALAGMSGVAAFLSREGS